MTESAAAIGIAALSSLDNLSVGFCYALKDERIGCCANGLVASINSSGMLAMMFVGQRLVRAMPSSLGSPERVGSVMAGCVYIGIGLWEGTRLANVYASRARGAPADEEQPASPEDDDTPSSSSDAPSSDTADAATTQVEAPEEVTNASPDRSRPLLLWIPSRRKVTHGPPAPLEVSSRTDQSAFEIECTSCRRCSVPRRVYLLGFCKVPTIARNFVLIAWCCGLRVVSKRHGTEREETKAEDEEEEEEEDDLEERREKQSRETMGPREALVLGLALTGSNIAAGIAAGAAGLDPWITTVATFACSFCFMLVGQHFGNMMREGATTCCDLSNDHVSFASAVIFLTYGVVMLAT